MHRAIALFTAAAFLSAACAPPPAPARDVTSVAPERANEKTPLVAEAAAGSTPDEQPIPEPTPTTKAPPNDARGEHAMPRALGWFSLSFGLASGAVAIGTSILMVTEASTRNNDCTAAKVCSASGLNANSQLAGNAGWNVAAYAAAAVGIGVGAFLLITNPANAEKQTAIGVSPTSSGAGLVLRSTF